MTRTKSAMLALQWWFDERTHNFRKNTTGVAAIEFAMIAPIMILLFIGTLEVSLAVSVKRKVSRISSVVGDLIAQATDLDGNGVNNIMDASSDIMNPYGNTVKIRVTGVEIKGGKAQVVWSCNRAWTSAAVGTNYNIPAGIKTDGTFIVAARVQSNHSPMVGWPKYSSSGALSFDGSAVLLDEEIYLRPRIGAEVKVAC